MAFGLMPTLMQDDPVLQWWEIGTVAEIDDLKRKLAARENMPGYKENVAELKARIAQIEASIADADASQADANAAMQAAEGK